MIPQISPCAQPPGSALNNATIFTVSSSSTLFYFSNIGSPSFVTDTF